MVQKIRKIKPKLKEEKSAKNKLSKYIKKKPKHAPLTKRDNTYVFEGFYEKLKQIDVKQSHSLEANFVYDNVLRQHDKDLDDMNEEGGIFTSNFIQLLRSERANNKTLDFNKLYKVLEPFCFSYPLLLHNKPKIIELLLAYLLPNSTQNHDITIITAIQIAILDLMIALIKDFRQDIYQEFVEKIMPAAISVIDMQKVQILDKVFTLISFGIKYLSKSIKDDIANFYEMYFELLVHKNRYIRKFASQSISYVLRKINFDQKVIAMIIKQLLVKNEGDQIMTDLNNDKIIKIENTLHVEESSFNIIQGISDLFFEVIYGAGEGLHSKFNEVLDSLLTHYQTKCQDKEFILVIRCLFLKIVNDVDTEKQKAVYESLIKNLDYKEDDNALNLLMLIFKDIMRLKFGKRINNYAVIQIMQVFNKLLVKNAKKTQTFATMTKVNVAETLSILFYFKNYQVNQVFGKSQLDIQSSKNIFNKYIYKLINSGDDKDSIKILNSYFGIFMNDSSEITAFDDLDWAKVLALKQSSKNKMEFAKDSHQNKIKLLIKSINQHILKEILKYKGQQTIIDKIAMFLIIVSFLNESYIIQLNNEIETQIIQILKTAVNNPYQSFVIYKFISLCRGDQLLTDYLLAQEKDRKIKNQQAQITLNSMDMTENLILRNYHFTSKDYDTLNSTLNNLFDITNQGQASQIQNQLQPLSMIYLNRISAGSKSIIKEDNILNKLKEKPDDIVILRCVNANEFTNIGIEKYQELFNKLSKNLMKNQTELRLQSIKALSKFQVLDYLPPDIDEDEKIEANIYTGPCNLINLMLQFQEIEISFVKEKTKILLIKKIQTQLESGQIPHSYIDTTFNFLLGSFWIKFTPLFDSIQEALGAIIKLNPDKYGLQMLNLIEQVGFITQISHESEDLMSILQSKILDNEINDKQKGDDMELIKRCYMKEAKLDDEFMEVKDFYYNLTRTVALIIDQIMSNKELKERLFNIFYRYKDNEYALIYQANQNQNQKDTLLDQMTYANMIDSETYVKFRRQTYSKLYCFIEMFNKAENLKKIPNKEDFQSLMFRLINTSDTKLQKLALDCLIKSDYKNGVLRQYRKMLEGFTDDEKFKDMIYTLSFGSNAKDNANTDLMVLADEDAPKKTDKGAIPKLAEQHKLDVLPVVIKLLLSKLIKKKGSINKKTLYTRRNIVYQFISTLASGPELEIFFNELLEPFGLKIGDNFDNKIIQQKLAQASFNTFLNFINSLNIIIKQLGSLLTDYLLQICNVLIAVMSLTKLFIKHLKLTLAEDTKENQQIIQEDPENNELIKDSLYRFVGNQSKLCIRKSLGIVKQLYAKFSHKESFVGTFSAQIYEDIVQDQLQLFSTNYVSDRSQLIELLTIQWSSHYHSLKNYLNYKDIFPFVMKMLSSTKINPDVYDLHFTMLKNLISNLIIILILPLAKSIQGLEEKKDLFFMGKKQHHNRKNDQNDLEDQDDVEMDEEKEEQDKELEEERLVAQEILKIYIEDIATNLYTFSQNNLSILKQNLVHRRKQKKRQNQIMAHGGKQNIHETRQQSIKDLIYIMSEITNYLKDGDPINQSNSIYFITFCLDFLDMTIQIVSLKQLHKDCQYNPFSEDLLLYGSKSICLLLQKCAHTTQDQIDKILQLFITIKSLKVREVLSNGLIESASIRINDDGGQGGMVREEVLKMKAAMNKIKKGLADMELDYDLVIKTIEKVNEVEKIKNLNLNEIKAITYSILFLLQSEEFSVRDYSSHFLKNLFTFIQDHPQSHTFNQLLSLIEQSLLTLLKTTHDEMILKSLLETLRHFIALLQVPSLTYVSPDNLHTLVLLTNFADDGDDFFTRFLSIKLKQRAKSLQLLTQKLLLTSSIQQPNNVANTTVKPIDFKAIQAVILPLLNHVIFGAKVLRQQRRGMITYTKEEKRQTMDEALKAYEAMAKGLKWSEYYKMLKGMLYKLQKVSNSVNYNVHSGGQTEEGGDRQMERIITKCICKILDGFHFEQIPDAIHSNKDRLEQENMEIEKQQNVEDPNQEFQEVMKKLLQNNNQKEDKQEESDSEDDNQENQMIDQASYQQQLLDIQDKLFSKVLPTLERHLTDYEDPKQDNTIKDDKESYTSGSGSVRSFVVLSIAKTIRKLPYDKFHNQLTKLINSIITKGLRSRQLVHREKGRKALVKLLQEVSPRFNHLYLVFSMMNDLLTRGYQLQTGVYTIMYILQQLQLKGTLENGIIGRKIIELTSDKLMEELFGELTKSEKLNMVEDQQKNQIKEAKGKKAVAIFEFYAQYIDFNASFFPLLAPILRALDCNPSTGRVQQCEELLNRLSTSLIKNKSVKGDQLLLFLYSVIDKGINMATRIKINPDDSKPNSNSGVQRDYGQKQLKSEMFLKTKQEYKDMTYKVEMKWHKSNQIVQNKKAEEISGRVIANFGLMCLKKSLKNKGLILSNNEKEQVDFMQDEDTATQKEQVKEELKAKLDPFVPVLLNAFKTYHNPIVVSTLHVLGMIINLGLPSFKGLMKKFLNRLFRLFEQTANSQSDSDFINSLFKCTAELIKSYSTFADLTELQLKMLCTIIKQNLSSQNNPNQVNVFHLLRALVYRKFISPDLYDIIDHHVQDSLVTSLSPSIRSLCGTIFLQFLLNFPLEETRLSQHLNFLLKNVGTYFDSEGRKQILEVMEKVSEKMPREIMDKEAEKWVFTLMLRTVNEVNKKCQVKVTTVLKKLLLKVSPNKSKTLINTLLSMQMPSDTDKRQALNSAKLQVLGLYITTQPQLIKSSLDIIWQQECFQLIHDESTRITQERNSKKSKHEGDDHGDYDSQDEQEQIIQNPEMKRFLENIDLIDKDESGLGSSQKIEMIDDESQDKDKWAALYYALDNIQKLLTNQKLQKSAVQQVQKTKDFIKHIMTVNSKHHVYWIRLVIQKILENLLNFPKTIKENQLQIFGFKEQQDLSNLTFQLLGSLRYLPMTKDLGTLVVKNLVTLIKEQLQNEELKEHLNIAQLYKKASFIGRKVMLNITQAQDRLEQILVFFTQSLELFASLHENQQDNPLTRSVCEPILQLVYRIYTDDQYTQTSPPKTLSFTLVDYFSTHLDKSFFLSLYNQVKQSITQKRMDRKRQHKMMMVSKAAEWEKVKEKQRMKKRDKKKQKKREEKMQMALRKT